MFARRAATRRAGCSFGSVLVNSFLPASRFLLRPRSAIPVSQSARGTLVQIGERGRIRSRRGRLPLPLLGQRVPLRLSPKRLLGRSGASTASTLLQDLGPPSLLRLRLARGGCRRELRSIDRDHARIPPARPSRTTPTPARQTPGDRVLMPAPKPRKRAIKLPLVRRQHPIKATPSTRRFSIRREYRSPSPTRKAAPPAPAPGHRPRRRDHRRGAHRVRTPTGSSWLHLTSVMIRCRDGPQVANAAHPRRHQKQLVHIPVTHIHGHAPSSPANPIAGGIVGIRATASAVLQTSPPRPRRTLATHPASRPHDQPPPTRRHPLLHRTHHRPTTQPARHQQRPATRPTTRTTNHRRLNRGDTEQVRPTPHTMANVRLTTQANATAMTSA